MTKTSFYFLLISFLFVSCSEKEQLPNMIIFFTDDQGYADVGCYGAKGFETPNLDQLARDGIRFTDFYVPACVCTPSRAGLLTGRYPVRYQLHEAVIFPYNDHGLPPEEITLAEMLKTVGYSTACIGKWHLGHANPRFMPNNQGFDYYYGVPYSNDMDNHYYKNLDFQAPPLPVFENTNLVDEGPDQRFLTRTFTENAIHFIQSNKKVPFFLYLPHCMPHNPLHVSDDFKGKSEAGLYGDVIMELDWSMGEIVKTLKKEGIYENTLIIFTSDNGPRFGSALPLRGKKATTWEGGQRVPAIITWPNQIPSDKKSSEFVSTLDLFPTLAGITGAKLPENIELDGMNISKFLKNPDKEKLPDRPFYYYARSGNLDAVRFGKWKLHLSKQQGWGWNSNDPFPISLFNLEEDISEQNNLAEQYPELVQKLNNLILSANNDE